MVSTRTCDFSGEDIEPGTGIMYVRNDGTVLHFKDRKAEKNYFMGRESRKLEWTQAGRAAKDTRRPQETEAESEPEPETETRSEPAAAAGTDEGGADTPDLEAAEADDSGEDSEDDEASATGEEDDEE